MESVLSGHGVQEVAASVSLYVSAAQGTQLSVEEVTPLDVPAVHSSQVPEGTRNSQATPMLNLAFGPGGLIRVV
jgi:hypothetical protein